MASLPQGVTKKYKRAYQVYIDWVRNPDQTNAQLAQKFGVTDMSISSYLTRGLKYKWHKLT